MITRDSSGTAGLTEGGTPVVLGKIKRVKSMQPKPLEEEIAKSLGELCVYMCALIMPPEMRGLPH